MTASVSSMTSAHVNQYLLSICGSLQISGGDRELGDCVGVSETQRKRFH